MRLFLVGPKFDSPNSNFPDFDRTASYWRNLGHTVISTAELDVSEGADPEKGWTTPVDEEYISDLFRRDMIELVKCDAVVLLEGWKDDDQAQIMADVAYHCNMTAFENIGEDNFYRELDDDDEYEFYDVSEKATPGVDPRFFQVLQKMEEMHKKKQNDYGKDQDPFANVRASSDFGIPGWVGCMVRANDKMKRLQKFAQGGELINESVEDSFMDLAVYSVIGLILFQETYGKG